MPKSRQRKKIKRTKLPSYQASAVAEIRPSSGRVQTESHSPLSDEIWSVVSVSPEGVGSIGGNLTHEDAWQRALDRQANNHTGIVVMTDRAASLIGTSPIDPATIRKPGVPLVQ